MSNKVKHKTIVRMKPRLRFPEFNDDQDWKKKQLSQLACPVTDKAAPNDSDTALTLSAEYGLVMQGEYFGKKIASEDASRYIKVIYNDFVYNDRATKQSAYGTIKRLSKYRHGVVSPLYKCFRFNETEDSIFWESYFESGLHNSGLRELINEGARAGRFNISINKFLSTSVLRPPHKEQQKIANCLTSIDILIDAESSKLDALKKHKKGLIQALFPQEGETLPRVRFPEFRGAPKWEDKQLKTIAHMQAGKFVSASDIFKQSRGGCLYPCYGGNGLRGYTRTYTHSGKYPLIGRQGALCGNVIRVTGNFHATEHAVVVTSQDGINVDWLFYMLDFLNLNKYATGQAQPGLSVELLERIVITIPNKEEEQQKIADCLSSLDELIATQAQKLAMLKSHKKGLLQGLFPSLEEVG